jgi:hypothetical protein
MSYSSSCQQEGNELMNTVLWFQMLEQLEAINNFTNSSSSSHPAPPDHHTILVFLDPVVTTHLKLASSQVSLI